MSYPIIVTIKEHSVKVERPVIIIEEEPADLRGIVLPQGRVKRWAFKRIRKLSGYDGKIADWTRTWKGPWMVVDLETGTIVSRDHPSHDSANLFNLARVVGGKHVG